MKQKAFALEVLQDGERKMFILRTGNDETKTIDTVLFTSDPDEVSAYLSTLNLDPDA